MPLPVVLACIEVVRSQIFRFYYHKEYPKSPISSNPPIYRTNCCDMFASLAIC